MGQTMNPTTVCSGFQKCGVFPVKPDAIDCRVSIFDPKASLQQVNQTASDNEEYQQKIKASSSEKRLLYQRFT